MWNVKCKLFFKWWLLDEGWVDEWSLYLSVRGTTCAAVNNEHYMCVQSTYEWSLGKVHHDSWYWIPVSNQDWSAEQMTHSFFDSCEQENLTMTGPINWSSITLRCGLRMLTSLLASSLLLWCQCWIMELLSCCLRNTLRMALPWYTSGLVSMIYATTKRISDVMQS